MERYEVCFAVTRDIDIVRGTFEYVGCQESIFAVDEDDAIEQMYELYDEVEEHISSSMVMYTPNGKKIHEI